MKSTEYYWLIPPMKAKRKDLVCGFNKPMPVEITLPLSGISDVYVFGVEDPMPFVEFAERSYALIPIEHPDGPSSDGRWPCDICGKPTSGKHIDPVSGKPRHTTCVPF